ncbi:hypothetical protein [Paenibacillus glacialis]|uniref:F0F1-type ATP synthase n=1 Tax=Paenibacillus glacialis TaxID=494026 RepID=A0A168HR75_9BACL|nr:hypothetical protein [Paenibacillus glacialis]OAB38446.1 hypothetical protein PGLA_20355 [Paenibacillus glacialis]
MKITNLAILFVCIFFPFFIIMDFHVRDQKTVLTLNDQYTVALRTALQDAGHMLNTNELQELEAGYESSKYFKADKELALDTFYRTLYLNFGMESDPIAQGNLTGYIPAVAVIDYDGYYIYAMTEYRDMNGQLIFKPMWNPKKPYSYSDSYGNSINFTLDNYVHAYDSGTRTWSEGFQEDIQQDVQNHISQIRIPLMMDSVSFDQVRRSTIVKRIQEDLAYFINKHNEYATRYGINYTFKLPQIPQEEWTNSIDDIGMMAFIQGIPVGDQFYNNYAFGGGRLVKKTFIKGAVNEKGIKVYYKDTCSYPYPLEETFGSEKDAARAGYFPKECVNGQ